jgi:hypothetical protein
MPNAEIKPLSRFSKVPVRIPGEYIMKLITHGIVFFVFLLIVGCGTHGANNQVTDGDGFEGFPSYDLLRPIKEKLEVKVVIGSGTMQETVTVEISGDDIKDKLDTMTTTTKWRIEVESGKIQTILNTVTEVSTPEIDYFSFEVDEQLTSTIDGKPIDYHADLSKLGSGLPPDIIETLNKVQPQWITQEYHLDEIGTLIESGYKIRPNVIKRELLEEFFGTDVSSKIDNFEIVEGYSTYDGKDVIVTGYKVNNTFLDDDSTIIIKGKGYNLYEKESFIHLLGDYLVLIDILDNRGKTFKMKLKIDQLGTDYEVNGFIGAN